MVLQKRLDYSFNGYQVPTKRRATRLARRKATFQKGLEDNRMCAFDLLATVADNLLHEKQNTSTSSHISSEKDRNCFVKEECLNANKATKAELSDEASCDRICHHEFVKEGYSDTNKPFKAELSDEGSSDRKCFSNISSQVYNQTCLKKLSEHDIDGHSCIASIVTSSSFSEKFAGETLVDEKGQNRMENLLSKVELGSFGCLENGGCKLDDDVCKVKDGKFGKVPINTQIGLSCFKDPLDEKPPALISSCGNDKLYGYDDNMPQNSSKGCYNVIVNNRDDDENFSVCDNPRIKIKSFRPITCIDYRNIKKIFFSKYHKIAQESKHDTLSNSVLDGNLKSVYGCRKNYYKSQRSQMNIPFKKRKLFNCSSDANSNGYIKTGDTYSPKNDINQSVSCSSSGTRKDHATSYVGHSAVRSRDSHVKLRIKSLKVPELFIEIPETATIGSLKTTVIEAMTTELGGGLRVGVILHGKKVRDDSKTLLQSGISHGNHLDALDFALEPNSSKHQPPACSTIGSLCNPNADMPQPLIRHSSSPAIIHQRIPGFSNMLAEHQVTGLGNIVESDHDSAPSPIISSEKNLTDSKELITVPKMSIEALAVLPVHQKSKRNEIAQRRIRRPFWVAEVEALVQAVEKLGTGRWRDVKLSAFDNAKHRTYVDLKDKWKTLVHTARISPQQRRGEPVPQELLDRVLIAHAYWSQQQTKQQLKAPLKAMPSP